MTTSTPKQSLTRSVLSRVISVLLQGLIIGVIGAFLAVGFVESIIWISDQISALNQNNMIGFSPIILIAPVIGGLIVGGLIKTTEKKRPTSVADLIYSAQLRESNFPLRDGTSNVLAAIIGMGSGASVGFYGSLAIMGATLGQTIKRWFNTDINLAIGCGVAAMISTAFSAPIAAVIFVHEVILRHYSLRAFAPITVASASAFFINDYVLKRPPLFQINAERSDFAPEFLAFVAIGICGAFVAIILMRTVLFASHIARHSQFPLWLRPAVAGLGVGIIGQWIPEAMGIGQDVLNNAVTDHYYEPSTLLAIIIAKIIATALCIGFGFAGGLFSPSLLIGILFGALLGQGAELLYGDLASDLPFYAMCGMVAVVSPVIGGPLTAILIVFELTRNYELTTAVMISVVFSNVVAYRLFGRSLFDRQLLSEGFDLSHGRDRVILKHTSLSNLIITEAIVLQSEQTIIDAKDAMLERQHQECYVVDNLSKFLGKLTLADVLTSPQQSSSQSLANKLINHPRALALQHDISVWDALEAMQGFVGESIPIIDGRGFFIGVIYESTLVEAYLNLSDDLRTEEHASS